ncbi:hypothetical protein [Flavobacterium beibuense]|uniref:hypothetical protein n=1 Tax=Flavobacterium beibuense TaxID=657326 RepID=UPI003A912BF8
MATEYTTLEMRKEGATEMEQVLHKHGFQFVKKEVDVWYWRESVIEYTILCNDPLGKYLEVRKKYNEIDEKINKTLMQKRTNDEDIFTRRFLP